MTTSYSRYSRKEPRVPDAGPRGLLRQAKLDEHLPADHRLSLVYRIGAGLMGIFLVVFGVLGLTAQIAFWTTEENTVFGLNTNGALSFLSIVVGLALFAGMIRGGNFASTLNIALGVGFVLSGFVHLAVLETGWNILNFRISNVIFSFAVGVALLTFGMYGRVSGRLPHDNPYWQARHPGQAEQEQRLRHEARERQRELMDARHGRRERGVSPPRN
ncbi:hypothetical protein GCM10009716_09490 [Streptomyces sodiiphilus]|uniref:DUF4383 domain-containing protein n=1 Tax=Streptomyces sodiiphilus TaxID=226217 RepID=A0ABP5A5G7_9ACTN